MKRLNSLLAVLTAIFVLSFVLAGCSSSDDDDENGGDAAQEYVVNLSAPSDWGGSNATATYDAATGLHLATTGAYSGWSRNLPDAERDLSGYTKIEVDAEIVAGNYKLALAEGGYNETAPDYWASGTAGRSTFEIDALARDMGDVYAVIIQLNDAADAEVYIHSITFLP